MRSAAIVLVFSLSSLLRSSGASSLKRSSPEAVVISPSEYFEGNDGPWSSFDIRIGEPDQVVRVLVSTASPESLVVLSGYGCSAAAFSTPVPSNCSTSRGVLFNPNQSSTWDAVGNYGINGNGVGLEANLGYSETAEFAFDTLGIGLTGPSLKNQTVAGIATAEPFYLGIFGLNNQPVNFSSLGNYSAQSFLTTLKSQSVIPSLSWSYTAGAQYRLKQVYGQLIFSGYDTSRFDTNNSVSFTMAGDVTRDLVVFLQSISYSGSSQAVLLSDPIAIFIDSTDPNLWLPDSVCDAFEKSFGLTADSATGLYLVNSTQHAALLGSNAEVAFTLSDVSSGGQTVTITLPYASFDLTAQPPLVNSTSYYFPLKRAANSTQYTLGRTFLQEAYLSADYERNTFNVSACVWNEGAVQNIVTIPAGDGPSPPADSSSDSLSPGAIAGIVVGCVLGVALVAAILVLAYRRRNLVITYTAREPKDDADLMSGPVFNSGARSYGPTPSSATAGSSQPRTMGADAMVAGWYGLQADGRSSDVSGKRDVVDPLYANPPQMHELHGESSSHRSSDVGARPVFELPGSRVPQEDSVSAADTASLSNTGRRSGDGVDLVSPATPVLNHGSKVFRDA